MAKVIPVGQPVNDAERSAIAYLRDRLPDSFVLLHNFEIERQGERFEIDIALLTPHALYEPFISAGNKQLLAILSGGLFGLLAFLGVSILLHRRLSDERIRATSKSSDILLLILFWLQLALGLLSLPLSWAHLDGSVMMRLAGWAQHLLTFRSGGVDLLNDVHWVFKVHMVLGMTIFLIFPFTRLVHIWSGFASLAYLQRPYQLVRSRRLNVPAGEQLPGRHG
jgi:nitrate reductase gamma subunit